MHADVVIVGAGPAGCAAAFDLTSRGLRVLLLDRTAFPRRKPCAGGLTVKALRALRYCVAPVIQRTVQNLAVSCRLQNPKVFIGNDPICHLVERAAFDLFCLEKTVAAGAEFRVVNRIDGILESAGAVTLIADGEAIQGRFLIGADGVHSRIRRITGRFPGIRFGFAVEAVLPASPRHDTTLSFDFSQAAGGYGWVFPKKNHINVGLYTHRCDGVIRRKDLDAYIFRKLGHVRHEPIRGYALGLGGWRYRPGWGRILLAGDAAGLVDPLLGEGLYHAIVSGQRAAAAIGAAVNDDSDACQSYAKALVPIQRELLFSQAAAAFFYRLPVLGHGLLISPAARIPLMKGFARGMSLLPIFLNGYRFWLGRSLPKQHSREPF